MTELELIPEEGVAGKYISTALDENGVLQKIDFHNNEHFNFAYDVVDVLGKKCPAKTAMLHISKDGRERRITFKDMMEYSSRTANYFQYLGIKKGDRVLVVLKRHYQFWFTVLALHKIGAIIIPASYLLVKKDFEYRFRAARVDAVVSTSDGDVAREIDKACRSYDGIKAKVLVGGIKAGWNSYNREIKYFAKEYTRPANSAGGEDPMLMFFTSGTTSYPKIAAHTFNYPLGHFITAKYWHQVDPEGLHLAISDTGWGKAMWGKLYGQWLCEAPIFTYDYDEFFAKEILAMLEKYKITTFCAPPTVYRVLVHTDLAGYNLSCLKNATTAGEALNSEIYNKFYKATGLKIMEGFGQTETTLTVGTLKGVEPRPGSMGKASPQYDISIVKPDGTPCDIGEVGEIVVKTSDKTPIGLFMGYYLDDEKTAKVWHNGYYHTGDTAYMDKDNYLWYVGRVDDLIKSAGFRIGPFEIESEIMKLPYVLECAVTSVPDKIRGQAIKASIVLIDGIEATDQLRKETMKFLRSALASYKRPKIVDFVKTLPKTSSGKVRRAEIKENDWNKEDNKDGKDE
ncbi:acetyl-CoA synthetase [Eubacterium ruminantium]|uniref:Transcriptional regulator, XRE family with cupin sensor n=1 Tax=Eubacterium ruminantium TaxID=42322 RepID=A0A1T4K5K9_9FIRM|nr:AMP-binding protein [Eubacterium ruminantium]SCW27533.1 acetyl-CoA synthetase [Eubacterium ruminantium]SDM14568.1 transcriptional regulator, XRE family with cupin sensor [Eubacterium ruminantium]SJZ37692.1 transcriptional regulator, XRE family with cupin sensor [Eubacterium ruminantium]